METATIVAILIAVALVALAAGAWLQWRRRRGRVMAGQSREKRR